MTSASSVAKDAPIYQPRNYQLEMFEASMKENIIVAMDTGSGKTNIALLRIAGELESDNAGKLIWFLAPTVALCGQQHKVITENIPAVRARTLTGLDKVELWTNQIIWDAVLKDVQVVVSTHAVLADAMSHGFVKISQLGLIIFDEAHHCMRRHPANKIMQEFYHPTLAKLGRDAVPRIMGLTASPVVRSSKIDLLTIESNLDSKCKTPRIHRQELLEYSNRPKLQQIWYTPLDTDEVHGTKSLNALRYAWETLDLNYDPYVQELQKDPSNLATLQKTLLSRKTYCNGQIKKLLDRSDHLFHELGGWAADYYIHASKDQVKSKIYESSMMMDWADAEKTYLIDFMDRLPEPDISLGNFRLSPKMEALIKFLDSMDDPQFSGIIFTKQRVTVSVMERLLSVHPATKSRFRCAAYVGWSNGNSRKELIGELLTLKSQQNTLDEFRDGRKNLIIATDVLEEGIDISACKAVVCYDKPPTLKSFVQRRGRARQKQSVYAILLSTMDESGNLSKWQILEKAMIEAYQDDERQLQEARCLEELDEDVGGRLVVDSTGAVLIPNDACAHLNHFCAILPREAYSDNAPKFSFETNDYGKLKATVTLPSCVHPAVRRASGEQWWNSERAAVKETSFLAYKALYKFGLVTDNLLPLTKKPEFTMCEMNEMPAIVEVSEQYDPWAHWASSWSSPDIHQTRIAVRLQGNESYEMHMKLTVPVVLPPLLPLTLYWDNETTFLLSFEPPERMAVFPPDIVEHMREVTAVYLQATARGDLRPGRDFVALFGPELSHDELGEWLHKYQGNEPARDSFNRNDSSESMGIVRDEARYGEPFLFKRWVLSEHDSNMVGLECEALPRRRNFLHRQTLAVNKQFHPDGLDGSDTSTKLCIISAETCTVDKLSFSNAVFGLFISPIMDRLEATMIATSLCETILQNLGFSAIEHVITAITTPSALALTNYQRYEFLGDSLLKYTVSSRLYYEQPNWHEGYLSEKRNSIVQNFRLARAALELGLDSFIISKSFTPRRWTAPLISEKMIHVAARRSMSSKVLADVVEALIGAAFLEGGYFQAEACIHRFLPEVTPPSPEPQGKTSHLPAIRHKETFRYLMDDPLQEQIGYTFNEDSLLFEALTHPSCQHDAFTQSYQRLEFLGDAVLDMLIVPTIFQHAPERFSPGDMTRIKHAVVNGNLLAFLCMEFALERESTDVQRTPSGDFTLRTKRTPVELWRFMRCEGVEMKLARDRALTRYHALRDEIAIQLTSGTHYPWEPLAKLNADKFFSDVIESIIGAIYVDSNGNLEACERFIERIGLLAYLRRLLQDEVVVMHPKNLALQLVTEARFNVQRVPGEFSGQEATYRCEVRLDDVDTVDVEGCLSTEEAEVRAANMFIEWFMAKERGETVDAVK
ncbi:ATP-dependent helicase dcl2 [Aspergillus steynii IBT 23096]|uniref:ATP-dependent helicase dcl2 n=1 Tax=Aspergillus steynii IBT 23096 TaxID=1392250 RepID=A0A2I2FW96_9EURO|nr:ATP-dependent helicase dcl2 [Aspergillus steynii IBT 23096]PLB44911.1 ATP-dependent helicase dcl2 [Aspergillus steynii IBT 23096]